jgi:Yip1 domain
MIETIKSIWPSLWKTPKIAIREAMEQHEKPFTVWFVILFGITLFIEQASNRNLGDDLSTLTIFIFAVVLGPLLGVIGWSFLAGSSHLVAKWLGGVGSWEETRIATTWSTPVYISKWIILFFQLITLRGELFRSSTPIMDGSLFLLIFNFLLLLLDTAVTIWYFYTFSQAVAEVHDFPAWKGFLSIVLIPGSLILLLIVLATVV